MMVDGNAHMERHVRRRRSGERFREKRGGMMRRDGRASEGGGAFGPGARRGMLY